jgi:predicted membrane channel-forming protein YqfA (hemolysin III family)
MDAWILIVIIAWFGLGAIIAAFIYMDMKDRRTIDSKWVIVGLLLNLIGLIVYHMSVRVSRRHPFQYPPSPRYEAPSYGMEQSGEEPKEQEEVEEESPDVEYIEGIPRCPHCGAAISSRDWECPRCGANLKY